MTRALLGGAVLVLAVALIGSAADAFSEDAVDWLAVAGLGLLAAGQAWRARTDRSPRTLVTLLLVLGLIVFVVVD